MYPERYVSEMHDTCEIHAGYMQDTCILRGVIKIHTGHPRYMMRYMHLKCIQRDMRDTCILRGEYVLTTWEHFDEAKGDLFALHLARSPEMWDLLLDECGKRGAATR